MFNTSPALDGGGARRRAFVGRPCSAASLAGKFWGGPPRAHDAAALARRRRSSAPQGTSAPPGLMQTPPC
eukprot:15435572-Alexandrium_andersonii.AAC.1